MKRHYWIAGTIALLVASMVGASNMAFKLNKWFIGVGTNASRSGTQDVGLPYQPLLQKDPADPEPQLRAGDLRLAIIAAGGADVRIARFNPSTDGLITYAGISPMNNFDLLPGEGYRIKLSNDVEDFIIQGSHIMRDDTGDVVDIVVPLFGPGMNSRSGNQLFAPPYHSTAIFASQLHLEILTQTTADIPKSNIKVSRFNPQTDGTDTYAGLLPSKDFRLIPGEAYQITTSVDIEYKPSHY